MTNSTYRDQAYAAFKSGAYEEALHLWRRALIQAGEDRIHRAALLSNIGIASLKLGRAEDASHAFEQAISQYEPDECHCSLGKAYMGLGRCYTELGNIEQAISSTEQAAAIFTRLDDTETLEMVQHNLSELARLQSNTVGQSVSC
ncbi:MAG: tetratricopeptide repeat protein [Tumebacillaceae bacterium]